LSYEKINALDSSNAFILLPLTDFTQS